MSGPVPAAQPQFPDDFLDRCRQLLRKRNAPSGQQQRARLVLRLHECCTLCNVVAGAAVDLHPNSVRLWRRRWSQGKFALVDQAGRGRKATFSPS